MSAKHAIATGHPAVTQVCAEILADGGNAFDAVVAGGFLASLAEPALTSLAGGGFLLAKATGQNPRLFDFFVDAPGRGAAKSTPEFAEIEIQFPATVQAFQIGRGSIAVPGVLKGLLHTHEALGVLPRSRVMAPAIAAAKDGLVVNNWQARLLSLLRPILLFTPASAALFAPAGDLLKEGERIQSDEMAGLLDAIAHEGADAFYRGEVARKIEAEVSGRGGILTAADLANYAVIEREPLEVDYRGRQVFTNPAPSLGGTLIALGLALLEGEGQSALGSMPFLGEQHAITLVRMMREVGAFRKMRKTSPEALDEQERALAHARIFSRGTTHMTVADANGNVASMTTSNGEGSGVLAPDTGIMLNNMLGEDDLFPDGFSLPAPGTRIGSMMAPTLVCEADGTPSLVLGSGGSKRIRTAITQVLTHVLDFDRTLADAIAAPRLHWDGDVVQIEPGLAPNVVDAVAQHAPTNLWSERDVYFGGVHAVLAGVDAAGDLRRGGDAKVFDA